jgi:DNA-binding response OmpR family regulator
VKLVHDPVRRPSWRVPTNSPPRVLLAEDDDDMREIIARALRSEGFEVVPASDGGRVLCLIGSAYTLGRGRDEFDLVLVDIHMPVCSGLSIVEELRKARWSTPVIVITSLASAETRAHAHAVGAVLFEKPFDTHDLRTVALSLLTRPASSDGGAFKANGGSA